MKRFSMLLLVSVVVMISTVHAQVLERDVALAPFANLSKATELDEYKSAITEWIFTDLANDGRLSLVDRSMMDATLEEMMLADMGVVDADTAAQVGLKVGARNMFIGKLTLRGLAGDNPDIPMVISTQLIDVETSRVISGWKVSCDKNDVYEKAEQLARNIVEKIFPMAPGTAAFRSLLVPGWGQLSNERSSGYAFLGLEAIALGGLVWSQLGVQGAQDDLDAYNQQDIRSGGRLQELEDDVDSKKSLRNVMLIAAGGVWVTNVFDAWLESRMLVKRHEQRMQRLQVGMRDASVQVTLHLPL